jgi:hypothetical protein
MRQQLDYIPKKGRRILTPHSNRNNKVVNYLVIKKRLLKAAFKGVIITRLVLKHG